MHLCLLPFGVAGYVFFLPDPPLKATQPQPFLLRCPTAWVLRTRPDMGARQQPACPPNQTVEGETDEDIQADRSRWP